MTPRNPRSAPRFFICSLQIDCQGKVLPAECQGNRQGVCLRCCIAEQAKKRAEMVKAAF